LLPVKLPVLGICDVVGVLDVLLMVVGFPFVSFGSVVRCAPRARVWRFSFCVFWTIYTSLHSITKYAAINTTTSATIHHNIALLIVSSLFIG
jgi:hypothetical protein